MGITYEELRGYTEGYRYKSYLSYATLNFNENNNHFSQWDVKTIFDKGDKNGDNMLQKQEHHDVIEGGYDGKKYVVQE